MTLDWLELESLEKWKERRRMQKWRKTTTRFTSSANEEQEGGEELEENDGGEEEEQQQEQETEGEQGENGAAPSVESKPRPTLQWDEEDETARAEEEERDQNKGKELVVRRSREEDEEDFAQRGLKHLARPRPQGQELKEGGADAKANVICPSSSIRQQHEAGQSSSFTKTAIYIDFEDVRYGVKLPWPTRTESIKQHLLFRRKVKRELLRGLSGHLRPGTLNAIMGPSGAGKTTLLNFLSGRLKRGSSSGDVLINGNKRGHEFKYMSAYVMQEETLLSNLTPRELLTYAAYLRLPRTMPWKDKRDRVEKVLEVLGLMRCADTRVGEPGIKRGISGGERRRVTIGLELMNDPQLIFLDEPTSGLDSATAESVVILLSKLAQQGRTVVCTIHQPSTQIFFTFDELLLLARGRFIYTGPVKEVTPYFGALGFPCPSYTNPADHVMHLVSKTEDITEEEHQQRIEVFIQKHAEHQKQLEYQPPAEYPELPQYKKKRPNALIQFFVLLMRSWLQTIRDPAQTVQRLAQNIGIGLFTGFLWFQVDNNQTGLRNTSGALFLVLTFIFFGTGNAVLYLFPLERPVFLREYNNGMYGVVPYYFSKSLVDLPFNIVNPVIFGTIVYWIVGLRYDVGKFWIFIGILILLTYVAQSLAFACSAYLSLRAALGLFPVIVIPLVLLGGFYLSVESTPGYFIWLQYLSPFFYGFMGLAINQFEGQEFTCDDDELREGVCPITSGDQQLEELALDQFTVWIAVVALLGLLIILRVLSLLELFALVRFASAT